MKKVSSSLHKIGLDFIKFFLERIRKNIQEQRLNEKRLPFWVKNAKVRWGWINDTLLFVLEDSTNDDFSNFRANVWSDLVILLDIENYVATSKILDMPYDRGTLTWVGEQGVHLNIKGEYPEFFHFYHSHASIILSNFLFSHSPSSNLGPGPLRNRFVPFALYVHKSKLEDNNYLYDNVIIKTLDLLKLQQNSTMGDVYENRLLKYDAFSTNKESTIIILGKDSDSETLDELIQVKDFLLSKNYDALLIKELPEIPETSNLQKVRMWTSAARFCVMVDRYPSGHIAEYNLLKEQETIFAFLRPKNGGSTYMIGDSEVNQTFIKTFVFTSSPISVLDQVITWAEEKIKERVDFYNKTYPWRH